MRNFLLAGSMLAGLALAAPAMSQTTNMNTTSGASSQSGANAVGLGGGSSLVNSRTSSGSRAGAGASATSGQSDVQVNIKNVSSGTGYRGGRTGTGRTTAGAADPPADPPASTAADPAYTGTGYSGTTTIRNTPEIIAPSIVGGNPCTVGASGGVALPGFGIVAGGSWEGRRCEQRQSAALLYNMGHDAADTNQRVVLQTAAVEIMCNNDDVRDALRRAGRPCVADQPRVATAPVANAAPVVVAAAAPVPPKPRPAWCTPQTLDPKHLAEIGDASRDYIRQECGV